LKLSTSIDYATGRGESDATHLKGLGDIDAGTTFNVFEEFIVEQYFIGAKYIDTSADATMGGR